VGDAAGNRQASLEEFPGAAVIRLDPWRLKAADAKTLAAGGEPQVWRA
jgi:hypothetical protein